ncbi:MAG TPA: phosphoglycerate kinase [Anaerolineae bacterium]|nr:phosphoglycerate kinase [Anaerolineae bacterium]HOR01250.1 phosphoglycerate kinase [Anaerolineae bacterium]HPL79686.1 phosphoglycerate kinase [Burkholderiaceae bacterium]
MTTTPVCKKTIRNVDVDGKRVLVRVDFNVPQDESGRVTDDTRIRAALPTIEYLRQHGARVILTSHLGRPKGKVVDKLRLDPVADRLSALLGQPVRKLSDAIGPEVREAVLAMRPGDVLLLENLRFYPEEEANDSTFARQLASLADLYVNDAFGTAHRAHASTEGVAHYMPAVAGLLMAKEIEFLGQALGSPRRPFVAILGGAKVSDKIAVIDNLLPKVDRLLIGGGMANTFFLAKGYDVGDSLVEVEKVDVARDLLARGGDKLVLPSDVVIADAFSAEATAQVVAAEQVPAKWRIMDIGPDTVRRYSQALQGAHTVVWNGPMGVFEFEPFAAGTIGLAHAVADLPDATTIVGGGDSAAAVEAAGVAARITHISTGGGASLEFLEGKVLPGVAILQDCE